MTFTEQLWAAIKDDIYPKIQSMPFNQELIAGTLSREKFEYYICQDSLYLAEFARAMALLGSRSPHAAHMLDFFQFAQDCIMVERALHDGYITTFKSKSTPCKKSPTCTAYTSFILATTATRTYEEGVAAVLPCFWIYREIGHFIHKQASKNNPYQEWINTYAGEEFDQSVEKARAITEALAQATTPALRTRMLEAFITASRYEWMFWDSAYRLEQWTP